MSLLREGNAVKQCSQSRLSPAWAVEMSLQRGDPVGGDGCTAQTRPGWEGWMFSVCAQCHPSPKTRLGKEGCALQGLQRGYHPNLQTPCIFQLFKKKLCPNSSILHSVWAAMLCMLLKIPVTLKCTFSLCLSLAIPPNKNIPSWREE